MVGDRCQQAGALAVVVLAVLSASVPLISGTDGAHRAAYTASTEAGHQEARAAQERSLHRTITLSLTPDTPGEIDVHAAFDIPSGVTDMIIWVPQEATVTNTNGFTRENETRYRWTRTTDHPSISFRHPPNKTAARRRGRPTQAGESYTFVDTGPWALIRTPALGIRYAGVGEQPALTRDVAIDGTGVPGTSISYLGPYEEHARTAEGQRLRLIVPAAAEMAATPGDVLSAVGRTATQFDVGTRDAEVLMYAAPTTVQWGAPGIQIGPNEFWVRDSVTLSSAGNIWLHEYVHTRQDGSYLSSGQWLAEATAEYYATHYGLRHGLISYSDYHGHLSLGTRPEYAQAELTSPATWEDNAANYWKGALVAAAIDRQIRLETGGEKTLEDAYDRIGGRENLTNTEFLNAVGAVAGSDVRAFAERYTTQGQAPALWNETEHAVAFGSGMAVSTAVSRLAVEGPSRNGTIEPGTPLVPGETLTIEVSVTNTDTWAGRFAVVLGVDGQPVQVRSGVLAPDASTTVEFARRFDQVGERRVTVGDTELTVPVRRPAVPTVRALSVPERAPPGEPFGVDLVLANPADRPAAGPLPVRANGETVATANVTLAPGGETRTTVEVSFDEPGRYTLSAGNVSQTVEITADATPPGTPRGGPGGDGQEVTEGFGPGVGIVGAVLALVLTFLGIRRA